LLAGPLRLEPDPSKVVFSALDIGNRPREFAEAGTGDPLVRGKFEPPTSAQKAESRSKYEHRTGLVETKYSVPGNQPTSLGKR
jgi:hypothetical protein